MPLPLGQAHHIQGKLVGLKGQLQAAGGTHTPPGGHLAWVKIPQPPAQRVDRIVPVAGDPGPFVSSLHVFVHPGAPSKGKAVYIISNLLHFDQTGNQT
jgi:hypothetical protein